MNYYVRAKTTDLYMERITNEANWEIAVLIGQ